MSDIRLPLWLDDESDVRPEHRLSYAHMLYAGAVNDKATSQLFTTLKLGPPLSVSNRFEKPPPLNAASAQPLCLDDAARTQIAIALSDGCTAVFAPHSLFRSNAKWIQWNKRAKGVMVMATRLDLNTTSYRAFESGKLVHHIYREGNQLRDVKQTAIKVSFGGVNIFRSPPAPASHAPQVRNVVTRDMNIQSDATHAWITDARGNPVNHVKWFQFRGRPR